MLYMRPGCHLCDVAREVIETVGRRHGFEYEEVDVETDEKLELEYGLRIPVVTVDGVERFEIRVDERELEELVR